MASYPTNDTAYSAENLCEELPVCMEARTLGWKNFDEYCSGCSENCPSKILTSPKEFGINDILAAAEGRRI